MSKSIAILVHNDIRGDARVRKGAGTFVSHGFEVDLFGYSNNPNAIVYNGNLEGERTCVLAQPNRVYKLIQTVLNYVYSFFFGRIIYICLILLAAFIIFVFGINIYLFIYIGLALFFILIFSFVKSPKFIADYVSSIIAFAKVGNALYGALKNKSYNSYDVIYCHDFFSLIAGVRYKKRNSGCILVWDAHELYEEVTYSSEVRKDLVKKVIREAIDHIDAFVTISDTFVSIYEERYPKLPKGIVVRNATRQSQGPLIRTGKLRKAANVGHDVKICLFQGGLANGRGITKMLEASSSLPDNWVFVFMGSGPLSEAIERCARNNPRVSLIPPAPYSELAEWTSGADIGIIPYENQSLNALYCTPNKLWEYPNAGVPILATGLVEMERFINEHKIGCLLPREFGSDDLIATLGAITDEQLEDWRRNCLVMNEQEHWGSYEANLLRAVRS